jgi:hypothetical protein
MTCARGIQCECIGRQMTLRMFCEHWIEPEKPRDDLDRQSDLHWATVPESDRRSCLAHLRKEVPPEVIDRWAATYARGNRVGSDDIRFHLGVGMAIRNALRDVLPDAKLPAADAGLHWDDYYVGALNELVLTWEPEIARGNAA